MYEVDYYIHGAQSQRNLIKEFADVEQAGGDDAHGPQKALGKGHGKIADVIARQIQHPEGLLLSALFAAHQRRQQHISHTGHQRHQHHQQH